MNNEQNIESGKILYITGYGNDENETVVYALNMPVNVRVTIEEKGNLHVVFYEHTPDKPKFICHTYVVPDVTPPAKLDRLVCEKQLDVAIAKTVGSWIAIYMRDGIFCTDSKKETFLRSFDLRDIAERLSHNMNDIYSKYQEEYE